MFHSLVITPINKLKLWICHSCIHTVELASSTLVAMLCCHHFLHCKVTTETLTQRQLVDVDDVNNIWHCHDNVLWHVYRVALVCLSRSRFHVSWNITAGWEIFLHSMSLKEVLNILGNTFTFSLVVSSSLSAWVTGISWTNCGVAFSYLSTELRLSYEDIFSDRLFSNSSFLLFRSYEPTHTHTRARVHI